MKKENQKGQALIEFVIILPIFIFMILIVIDLGKILYFKNHLESRMEDVITVYETQQNKEEILKILHLDKQIDLNISEDNDYVSFELLRPLDIVTPGLNLIFKSPYNITVKRVIYDES